MKPKTNKKSNRLLQTHDKKNYEKQLKSSNH